MRRLIFATGNEHKMVEIREILGELPVEILSMKDVGIKADIVENGNTFEENALIKSKRSMLNWQEKWFLQMTPVWKLII